jgi:hypothetical protein
MSCAISRIFTEQRKFDSSRYHLARFQDQTKEKIGDLDFVFEFGGGYGSMCRLIHNIKFKGRYVIFDLPMFSALQVFFLKMIGLDTELGVNLHSEGISCVSEISQLEEIIKKANKKSLFIATWSISETSTEARNPILKVGKRFNLFLIAYQKTFGKVDNVAFFDSWTKQMDKVEWYNSEITHLPNNYYLFGRKTQKS